MVKVNWTEEKVNKLKLLIENSESFVDIQSELNVSYHALKWKLNKLGLVFKSKVDLNIDNINEKHVVNFYKKHGKLLETARYFNCSSTYVKKILKINKIKINSEKTNSKYIFNIRFFETIDTEEKAYFLGFLFADGNVDLQKSYIRLGLQEKDKEILTKLNKIIESNRPLHFYSNNNRRKSKKSENIQDSYILNIGSNVMCKDLINLGCTPKKSFTLKFPTEQQVPKELQKHFIRGYFDGDGSLWVGGKDAHFSIISTINFNTVCQNVLIENLNLNKTKLYFPKNVFEKTICYIQYGGAKQVFKIMNWLYKDATVYLERKFIKFKELKSTQEKIK